MKTLILLLMAQIVARDLPPEIPHTTIVEGRVGIVALDAAACSHPLRTLGATWRCRRDNTLILAVPVGYPLGPWGVTGDDGQPVAIVDVGMTAWPDEHRPARKVSPAPAGRWEADRFAKELAYEAHTDPRWADYHLRTPLSTPVGARYRITDPFGVRRFYGAASEPEVHSGVDLAAPQSGTWDVHAPDALCVGPGVVVLAAQLWDSGNTVIVYHGDGVYTSYSHLSSMVVSPGNQVGVGARLGVVGGSVGHGRIGTHLHLAMRVNGILVDPLESITALNRAFP